MAPLLCSLRLFLSALVVTNLFIDVCTSNTAASAFSTTSPSLTTRPLQQQQPPRRVIGHRWKENTNKITIMASEPAGESKDKSSSSTPEQQPSSNKVSNGGAAAAAKPKKRLRISAFDSMRFFLIVGIVFGHFIKFANPSDLAFKVFSQHNVIVGAFFALSGYVTAYTSTENGLREPSPKLLQTPKQKWILQRIFGYYPLHLLVLLLFSPIFLYADMHYSGWPVAAINGLMAVTLTQAWFPMHAEVWNAPTWFLSALSFATAVMPFGLPEIAKMDKKDLRKTAFWLSVVNILPKLGYWYDFKTFGIAEGITAPKAHPNMAMFNMQRFLPLTLVAEILLGAVACRLVMLDGTTDKKDKPEVTPKTNMLSTIGPLLAMAGLTAVRATGLVECSDLLVRSVLFVPLFLRLLMSAHRNTVNAATVKDPLVSFLSSPLLVALGNLTFPIFIVHGPVGQLFFKKLIATKLFGQVLKGPAYFGVYLATTVTLAWILQKTFLQSKGVANWSKKTVDQWSEWM